MDNYMDSFSTEEEAIEFRNKIQDGLKKGCLRRGWYSNRFPKISGPILN